MYALRLTTFAEADGFSIQENQCGSSKDGSTIAVLFSERDGSTLTNDFESYFHYLGIYLIKQREIIMGQKIPIWMSETEILHELWTCHVSYDKQQIKIYLHFDRMIKEITFDGNLQGEPMIKDWNFIKTIQGSILDEQADELYLLFRNQIQNLSGSLQIVHNLAIQGYILHFYMVTQSDMLDFRIINIDEDTLEGTTVDQDGKVEKTVIGSQIADISSLVQNSNDNLIWCSMISSNTSSNLFIDSNFNILPFWGANGYQFLSFGQKENHLFVYSQLELDSRFQVCYCLYEVQADKLEITQFIDCYTKDITSIDGMVRDFETSDGEKYFLFQDIFINTKRKDGDLEAQEDLTLQFPNDAYGFQGSSKRHYIFSQETFQQDQFVQFELGQTSFDQASIRTKIQVVGFELAFQPGVIVGFVLAGIAGLLAICGLIYLCYFCFRKANSDNAIVFENQSANVTPAKQNINSNQQHSLNNFSAKNKLQFKSVPVETKKMAQKLGQYEKCCVCLKFGCNTYLPCLHFYHQNCIVEWLAKQSQCSLCHGEARQNIVKFK